MPKREMVQANVFQKSFMQKCVIRTVSCHNSTRWSWLQARGTHARKSQFDSLPQGSTKNSWTSNAGNKNISTCVQNDEFTKLGDISSHSRKASSLELCLFCEIRFKSSKNWPWQIYLHRLPEQLPHTRTVVDRNKANGQHRRRTERPRIHNDFFQSEYMLNSLCVSCITRTYWRACLRYLTLVYE